jgi:hypothetical protein
VLARGSANDWTIAEGTDATLRALIGSSSMRGVLLQPELASYDLTGLIATAREQIATDPGFADRVESSTRFFEFNHEQLQSMLLQPGDPLPTALRYTPPPVLGPEETGVEDPTFDPASRDYDTDCARFFRRFPIGAGIQRCLDADDTVVGGRTYTVYSPATSLASFHWSQSHRELIGEAVARMTSLVPTLAEDGSLDIVLGSNMDSPADAVTLGNADGCTVVLYTHLQLRNAEAFKQIVARQLAHCLFDPATSESIPFATIRWLRDGFATFVSSLAFPAGDVEDPALLSLRAIDDHAALSDWSTAAFVWFEYLRQVQGTPAVVESVVSLHGNPGWDGTPASWPAFADLFVSFAQAYTDGAITDVTDTRLPTVWTPADADESVADSPGRYAEGTLPPFSFQRHLLVAEPEQAINLGVSASPSLVWITARSYGAGGWGPLPDRFPAACLEDNRLLVISANSSGLEHSAGIDVTAVGGC